MDPSNRDRGPARTDAPPAETDIRVVRYQPADRDDAHRFIRSVRSRRDSERLIAQWDWKYEANPLNDASGPFVVLLKDEARIAGLMGDLPMRVQIGEHVTRWVCVCDLAVHSDYQGRGLSRLLIREHLAHFDLGVAWMNVASRRAADPVVGTHNVPIRPLVRMLDVGPVVTQLAGSRALGAVGHALTRLTRAVVRLPAPRPVVGVTVSTVTAVDDRFDDLWRRASANGPVMLVRDRAYLEWRFFRRPDVAYTMLVATRGRELLGYLVLRRVVRAGLPWGYLVDFLVERESPAVWSMLVHEAIARFREDGVALVGCLANRPVYRRTLGRLGFVPWRWGAQGYFHARVGVPDERLHVARDHAAWHLTLGDGDVELGY